MLVLWFSMYFCYFKPKYEKTGMLKERKEFLSVGDVTVVASGSEKDGTSVADDDITYHGDADATEAMRNSANKSGKVESIAFGTVSSLYPCHEEENEPEQEEDVGDVHQPLLPSGSSNILSRSKPGSSSQDLHKLGQEPQSPSRGGSKHELRYDAEEMNAVTTDLGHLASMSSQLLRQSNNFSVTSFAQMNEHIMTNNADKERTCSNDSKMRSSHGHNYTAVAPSDGSHVIGSKVVRARASSSTDVA
jgi:hypothetical protein